MNPQKYQIARAIAEHFLESLGFMLLDRKPYDIEIESGFYWVGLMNKELKQSVKFYTNEIQVYKPKPAGDYDPRREGPLCIPLSDPDCFEKAKSHLISIPSIP